MKIDVGCGYRGDLHYPNLGMDVFIEPFLNNACVEWIKILRENGNPIIASAEDLPFRGGICDQLQCRAVMEHLPKPFKALANFKFVVKTGGLIEITIPMITNHFKHYLLLIFIAFPFGIIEVKGLMVRMTKHYHHDGLAHVSDVKPHNLTPFFSRSEVITETYRHKLFYGWWGKLIKKYITQGREPIRDIQGTYTVRLWK